jgi:hypothetical protein
MSVNAGYDSIIGTGWQQLYQLFADNGMADLGSIIVDSVKNYGSSSDALVYNDLRNSEQYKKRFAGNFERLAAGKSWLDEATYISQENQYAEIMQSYGAGDLAKRENYSKFIAGDVSALELSKRFDLAHNKVQKAVDANDTALLNQLRQMYPGITDQELANSLLFGKDGSEYLKNKINVAEVKAAETETGIKSTLGAEYLTGQGIDRAAARQGLSRVGEQLTGATLAAQNYSNLKPEEVQAQLEKENLLGQSTGIKKLASQARGQMSAISGTAPGSIKKKAQV